MTTTDTTETPEAPETPTEAEDTPTESREAAKWRRKLREAEAERDSLRETVTAMQRAEVERLTDLPKPDALWTAGTDLADLLTESGTVDPGKVAEAVTAARDTLGLNLPAAPSSDGQGNTGGGVHDGARASTFEAAFGPSPR